MQLVSVGNSLINDSARIATMKQTRANSVCSGAHHPRSCQWIVSSLSLCLAAVLALTVLYKLHSLVPEVQAPSFIPIFPSLSSTVKMEPPAKIAFLFLVRHKMPLDFLWEHFFQGAGGDEYTVYIHARPGFVYTKNNTQCSSFIDRQLKNPVLVEWGEASMLQAERLLLQEALKDPLNQRFILLSDSCVPLYNFRYIYNYVMFCHKSFVDSFTDAHDARYNYKMAPAIWKEGWRKGSQWFVLIRKHAIAVAKDNTVFPVFKRYCKRMALPEFSGSAENNWNHNCIPDEHYLQTLLAMRNLEKEIERRGVTYSQWKSAHQHTMDRRGWHPVTFDSAKTSLKAIKDIQNISEIHFVAAGRRERCGIDGKALPCYLFARKFTRGAGNWLLEQAAHIKIQPVNCRVKLRSLENLFPVLERCKTLKRAISPSPGMKRSTRSQAAALSKRRKPTATRASRSTIQKRASGGGTSSRKARSSKPTYFSLLKDVEHALKHEHMDGASVRKLKRHLEKRYGGKPFDGETCKMLRSAVARLHKKGRIKKHPTKTHVYKFKPPSVPAHHIFGTPAQRRAGRRAAARAAKRSRPSRSSRPTRRTR